MPSLSFSTWVSIDLAKTPMDIWNGLAFPFKADKVRLVQSAYDRTTINLLYDLK